MNFIGTNQIKNAMELSSIFTGFWKSYTLFAATEFSIFDLIHQKIDTISLLSKHLGLSEYSTQSLLMGLIELKVVKCYDRRFILTDTGSMLTETHELSLKNLGKFWIEYQSQPWERILEGLKSEENQFQKIHNRDIFNWINQDPKRSEIYYDAMHKYAILDYFNIPEYINLNEQKIILDVGCGIGSLAEIFLQQNNKLQFILYDLPQTIKLAKERLEDPKYPNIKFIEGNMFENTLPKSDVIFLSRIIHDWNDKDADRILMNCISSLNKGGELYVIEGTYSSNLSNGKKGLLNINMLLITGGKERTKEEYFDLLKLNNFHNINVIAKLENGLFIIKAKK